MGTKAEKWGGEKQCRPTTTLTSRSPPLVVPLRLRRRISLWPAAGRPARTHAVPELEFERQRCHKETATLRDELDYCKTQLIKEQSESPDRAPHPLSTVMGAAPTPPRS